MKKFLIIIIIISTYKGFAQKDSRVVFGPMLSLTSTSLNAKPTIGEIDPQKSIGIGLFARLRIMMLYAEFEGGFTSLKSKSQLTLPSGLNSQTSYTLNGWDVNSYIGWRIFKMEGFDKRVFGLDLLRFIAIFMVLIGGIGRIEGPIIGALIFWALNKFFSDYGTWYLIGLGLLAIFTTIYFSD